MPTSPESITAQLTDLSAQLTAQGRRVQSLCEAAFDTVFTCEPAACKAVIARDEEIDAVDVAIEKAAVDLLTVACTANAAMPPQQLRAVLTIVKVNNELERIADVGTGIAETAQNLPPGVSFPPTFRVLTNSVVGILRDCVTALQTGNAALAKVVLMSEAAVGEFKKALVREVQQQLAAGHIAIGQAAGMHDVAVACVVMADHCTNIAEQVLYAQTGSIVRHMEGRWEEVKV